MDRSQLLDLYAAETQEYLRLLQLSLLRLEDRGGEVAVAEAFRAAHTVKGLAAAMGYDDVAATAHGLEDELAALRHDGGRCPPALLDTLLARVDQLQRAVASALLAPAPPPASSPESPAAAAAPAPRPPLPPGTRQVLEVALRQDAPFKAARAVIILRALQSERGVLGWAPDPLPPDFDGRLHVFLDGSVTGAALQTKVRQAGEVAAVTLARVAGDEPEPSRPTARHVRISEQNLEVVADGIGELAVLRHRLAQLSHQPAAAALVEEMRPLLDELQRAALAMRMVPLREVFERLPRVVRDACRQLGRNAELKLEGEDIELDRAILGEITEPLSHLLRNAVAHGIEREAERLRRGKRATGLIRVSAEREHDGVRITVSDDGAGIDRAAVRQRARTAGLFPAPAEVLGDEELLLLLARPGFSLAQEVTGVSGRGVGLDAVVTSIRALGGALELHSIAGKGTSFRLKLPITLSLAQALLVRVGGEDYALPLTHLRETLDLDGALRDVDGRECVVIRECAVPLVRLRRLLCCPGAGQERSAVVAQVGERRVAVAVDELLGHERILVKRFDAVPGTLPIFTGATLLADGRPALVLDPLAAEVS